MTSTLARSPTTMSGREARLVLRRSGMGDRAARELLDCGLAGTPRRHGRTDLYQAHRVVHLAGRPTLAEHDLVRLCPRGWFVARRGDAARLRSRDERVETLASGWEEVSIWTRLLLKTRIDELGPLPFFATVAGHVYLGADLVAVGPGGHMVLDDPGPWFEQLRDRRVPTGAGRPWHVRLVDPAELDPPQTHTG